MLFFPRIKQHLTRISVSDCGIKNKQCFLKNFYFCQRSKNFFHIRHLSDHQQGKVGRGRNWGIFVQGSRFFKGNSLGNSINYRSAVFRFYLNLVFPSDCFFKKGSFPCSFSFFRKRIEVVGGYLSKSHSGKWNLECLLVLENSLFLNLCLFSSSQSVTERFIKLLELSSCFFWTRNFSETTHHKSFVFQSSPCGGLDEEGVPGWRHRSQPMCTSVGPCLLAEKIGKCSFVLFSHLWP